MNNDWNYLSCARAANQPPAEGIFQRQRRHNSTIIFLSHQLNNGVICYTYNMKLLVPTEGVWYGNIRVCHQLFGLIVFHTCQSHTYFVYVFLQTCSDNSIRYVNMAKHEPITTTYYAVRTHIHYTRAPIPYIHNHIVLHTDRVHSLKIT